MKTCWPFLVLLIGTACGATAQTPLPAIEVTDTDSFRADCRNLVEALDSLKAPLPERTAKELGRLLRNVPKNSEADVERIRKLLDARCLIGITINAESRVKAARGPLPAELTEGRETIVLVRVQNDAGVTHSLVISGPQVGSAKESDKEKWLEAILHREPPLSKKLSGRRVEYLILGLTPHETGKREATLKFDVGQGTQDLGFRAEVPILFTIQRADPSLKR
jgi:hypothetical protein